MRQEEGRRAACFFAVLLLRLHLAASRVQVVRTSLANDGAAPRWRYLSKFGFGLGVGDYRVRIRQLHPRGHAAALDLEPYLDEQWPAADALGEGCERRSFARTILQVSAGANGTWGAWEANSVEHVVRPHVWYFAVSACASHLPNGTSDFEIEFEAVQQGGSHFSIEQAWAPYLSAMSLLGFTVFLQSLGRRCHGFWSRTGSLHPVIWALACIVAAQYLAQLLLLLHLAALGRDGRGLPALEALGEALLAATQAAQTSLMLLVGMGYTLTRSRLGADLRVVLFVCGVVAAVQVALLALESRDQAHAFTGHEGAGGRATLASRLALYLWLLRALRGTAEEGGCKMRSFLGEFRTAASLHFLVYPLLWLVIPVFAQYWRACIMEVVLMAAQAGSNMWLASTFLERGPYLEVSSLGASPLPGGDRSPPRFYKDE